MKIDISIIADWSFLILDIIGAICTICSTFFVVTSKSNNIIIKLLFVCILFIIISCGYYISKLNKKYKDRIFEVSEMYHKMNHNIRDEIFKILYYYGKNELTQNLLDDNFIIIVKNAVDSLQNMLTILNNKEICVCIKYFIETQEDILNSNLKVLVRSSNVPEDRLRNNKIVKASEVTDYINIIAGNECYYYNKDILKDEQYNNTYNISNMYKTKIVVPIDIDINEQNIQKKNIVGFICADCNTANAFDNKFNINKSLMQGIADDLYEYFNDYYKYSSLISESGRDS